MNIINEHRVAQWAERSEYTSERLSGSNPSPMTTAGSLIGKAWYLNSARCRFES